MTMEGDGPYVPVPLLLFDASLFMPKNHMMERLATASTLIHHLSWPHIHHLDGPLSAALKKAKHSGRAYLKINDSYNVDDVTGLPTPFELTGDPRWNEGGELYRQYDLALDRKPIAENRTVEKLAESELPDDEPDEDSEEVEQEFSFDEWTL